MTFRYARHTTDLQKMEQFYTELVGLENLGGFKNHSSYDGIFLGYKTADWHLEFTSSPEKPQSTFDEDDALVFYVDSDTQLAKIKKTLQQKNINLEVPKNPYWVENGLMISDPDGFKIIFSVRHLNLDATDELTKQIKEKGIDTWMNVVTACRACNHRKSSRTPEQAGMPLLYTPYVPSLWEDFILRNRRILADQMEFLMAHIPKSSRLHA